MRRIAAILSLFICLSARPVLAVEDELVNLSNTVIENIYKEIFQGKDQFRELVDFDERVLTKNKYGIYTIHYSYTDPRNITEGDTYALGIEIIPIEDVSSWRKRKAFNYAFPLLGLKLSGYQKRTFWQQYDVESTIQRQGQRLWVRQQQDMPFQMELISDKKTYKVNEPIEFTVILKNNSQKGMWVKDLKDQNLNVIYDGKPWHPPESKKRPSKRSVLLKPKEEIRRSFKINGVSSVKTFNIFCSYNMTFEGIRPSNMLLINIVQ